MRPGLRMPCHFQQPPGVFPVMRLNVAEKWLGSRNPTSRLISEIGRRGLSLMSSSALRMRMRLR